MVHQHHVGANLTALENVILGYEKDKNLKPPCRWQG